MRNPQRSVMTWALTALFILPVAASAQVSIGINGGVVSSNLGGDFVEDLDTDSRTGFFGGASLSLPVAERLGLTVGAYFVQKGTESTSPGTVEASYLEVPVLLGVTLTGADAPVGFSLWAGPGISFELDCTQRVLTGSVAPGSGVDCDSKSTDFGVLGGATLSFPISDTSALFVNSGYELGLTKLDDSSQELDMKNRAFYIGGGVRLVVGGR
jgi:hypothetical protein